MKRRSIGLKLVGSIAGLVLIAGLWATASAQYGNSNGNVSLTSLNCTPATATGATAAVSAHFIDQSGNPVSGANCTFTIVSQPGTGAVVATTGTDGVATTTVNVGTAIGTIVFESNCGGNRAQLSCAVLGSTVLGANVGPGLLPRTGNGPEKTTPAWLMLVAGGLICLAGGTAMRVTRRAWIK